VRVNDFGRNFLDSMRNAVSGEEHKNNVLVRRHQPSI
jgi:hypothetical protein